MCCHRGTALRSGSLEILLYHSRSYEIMPFGRAHVSAYQYTVVFLLLFEICCVEYQGALEIWVWAIRDYRKWLFDRSHMISYLCSTVTMALSCIVYEIKTDIGKKNCNFFIPHLHYMPHKRDHVGVLPYFVRKNENGCLPEDYKKFENLCTCFDAVYMVQHRYFMLS